MARPYPGQGRSCLSGGATLGRGTDGPGTGGGSGRHGRSRGCRRRGRRDRPDPRGRGRRPTRLHDRRATGLPPSSPGPRVLLRGSGGGHRGAGRSGLDRGAGDPARLDRCVDLHPAQRPPPGHGTGRPGPQAVPVPPALASGPGRGQVRPTPRVRRRAARPADVGRGRPPSPHHGPGPRGRHRRAPPGRDPGAGRQRRVRRGQRVLRPDHAAARPRRDHPASGRVLLRGQGWPRERSRRERSGSGPGGSPMPRVGGPGALRLRARGR